MLETNYEVLLLVITILTLILQIYVLFLIQFKSPVSMKAYRYFLNLIMGWDIAFNLTTGLVVQPYPISPYLAVGTRGICSIFGQVACYVSVGAALYTGSAIQICQIYSLMYRFCILLSTKRILDIFMSLPVIILLWIFAQSMCIGIGISLYRVLLSPEELAVFSVFNRSMVAVPLLPNEIIIAIDTMLPMSQLCGLILLILIIIAETFSMSMIYGIISYLHQHSMAFSKQTYKMHIQLVSLLAVQLFSPMILIAIPAMIFIYAILNDIRANQVTLEIGFTFIMMYGSFNAVSTIFFVSPYRIYTYKWAIEPILKRLGLLDSSTVAIEFSFSHQNQSAHTPGRHFTI